MKRAILAMAIAAVAIGGTPARAADDPVMQCNLQVQLPVFPGTGTASIDGSQSSCETTPVSPVAVGSTNYAYNDIAGCGAGLANGTLSLHGEASPFTYRRAGTQVKFDLLHGGQHYSGLFEVTFVNPAPTAPDAILGACTSPTAATVRLVGAFALS